MPATALRSDVLSLVGNYQQKVRELEKELSGVERRLAKAIRDGKEIPAELITRKAELVRSVGDARQHLSSAREQESFDARAERWAERKSRAMRSIRGGPAQLTNLRDVYDLARGNVDIRSIAGSMELVRDLRRGGAQGLKATLKNAPKQLSSMLGLGALGAEFLPLSFAALAAHIFVGAHEPGQAHSAREAQLDKMLAEMMKGQSASQVAAVRDQFKAIADVGQTGSFEKRLELSSKKRARLQSGMDQAMRHAGIASNVLRRVYGMHVAGTPEDVEAVLSQLGHEGSERERAQRFIAGDLENMDGMERRTRLYYSRNPDAAARAHEANRLATELWDARVSRGVKGWN